LPPACRRAAGGGTDEAGQVLTFNVSTDNDPLFAVLPAIDATTGQLTYTPAADANGSATITVTLQDDGGTPNGGADTSAAQNFTITVDAVNDAPSFVVGSNQTVEENAGAQTVAGFATGMSPGGGADEVGQVLTFNVSTDNDPLFAVLPAIDASGELTYTPATDTTGSATVTVTLSDNGGTANGGADTSAAQNFTITVNAAGNNEPTVQASAINIDFVASRSMRIKWTAGNGDGSIAILRLAAPATSQVPPVDFTDYTADTDYTLAPATSGGSENFVVYKGTGTQVTVSGLTQNINYTIEVYAWGGFGVETDYRQTLPAQLDKITDGPAMHNYDNAAICGDCHSPHGDAGFVPRGSGGEAVCRNCHKPGGEAALKLDFNMHNTPNYAADDVDCGSCHEVHRLNPGGNTTESTNPVTLSTDNNQSFIRANVNKYITTATSGEAVYHTAGDDLAIEGGDSTTARGICQSCHSETDYHKHGGGTDASQCHVGGTNDPCPAPETDCRICHSHIDNFLPTGGSCTGCHNNTQDNGNYTGRRAVVPEFARLSTHVADTSLADSDCEVCHAQAPPDNGHEHGLSGGTADNRVTLWNVDATSPQTSIQLAIDGDPALDRAEAALLTPFCLDCHDSDGALTQGANALAPFTGSGAPADIDATWSSSSHGSMPQTDPPNGSGEISTCFGDGSFGCHASGHGSEKLKLRTPDPHLSATSPDFSEQKEGFCLNCHRSSGESNFDINSGLLAGNDNTVTSPDGAAINQMHDILPADGDGPSGGDVTCSDCHDPHLANSTTPNVDPDDTSLPFTSTYNTANTYGGLNYDSGSNLDPTNPLGAVGGPYTDIPDYVDFCLTCHDGTVPAGVTMPGTMRNIEYFYLNPGAGGNLDYHGAGDAGDAGNGFLKVPWVATQTDPPTVEVGANYAALNCTLCHDSHASTNIYHLADSIKVAGVQMEVGGWTGDTIGTLSGTTYTLPNTSKAGTQSDHDWGGFCSFCHQMEKHGVDEDKACRSGHMHGGGAF
jgi:hypothetical protein